jgi:hypothetical protein
MNPNELRVRPNVSAPAWPWHIFILSFFVLLLAGCGIIGFPPGKGPKAHAGYRAAAPVISALEKFHKDHGQYPMDVSELVPVYLPDTDALLIHRKVGLMHSPRAAASGDQQEFSEIDGLVYFRDADDYVLFFSYIGPGVNRCQYDSRTKSWSAMGHF